MRNTNSTAGYALRPSKLAAFGLKVLVPLASVSILLTACGGGSGDGGSGSSGGGQGNSGPLLQVGMQRLYSGTTTRNVAYTNPTANQQNTSLGYSFSEAINVLQAPTGTNATFDVQTKYSYTITQDPGSGMLPVSDTIDSYENLLTNGSTQNIVTVGEVTNYVQNDESANALGGGPYTATTVSNYNYPIPVPGLSFPLQTGENLSLPVGETQNTTFSDVNASGTGPSNGSNPGYTYTMTKNQDGSFNAQTNRNNGVQLSNTVNSDGSGIYSVSGGNSPYTATIGVPVQTNGVYTIPVNYNFPITSSTTNYSAADWYPDNGLPPSPLALNLKTVLGPVSTLPSQCSSALVQPNMYEVDTTQGSLSTTGAYTVTITRAFNANGVVVCSLQQETESVYSLQTGLLYETITTQTASWLTGVTD